MKLTWFGGTTLRVYIGGEIIVVDAERAPKGVNPLELTSGANRVVQLGDSNPRVDPQTWKPPRAVRAMDEARPVDVFSIGPETCLISGESDPPVLICSALELPRLGHWVDGSVMVLFGQRGAAVAEAVMALDLAKPRHLVLAADEETVDGLVDRLDAIDDRLWAELSFSSLEPGLALEV